MAEAITTNRDRLLLTIQGADTIGRKSTDGTAITAVVRIAERLPAMSRAWISTL